MTIKEGRKSRVREIISPQHADTGGGEEREEKKKRGKRGKIGFLVISPHGRGEGKKKEEEGGAHPASAEGEKKGKGGEE